MQFGEKTRRELQQMCRKARNYPQEIRLTSSNADLLAWLEKKSDLDFNDLRVDERYLPEISMEMYSCRLSGRFQDRHVLHIRSIGALEKGQGHCAKLLQALHRFNEERGVCQCRLEDQSEFYMWSDIRVSIPLMEYMLVKHGETFYTKNGFQFETEQSDYLTRVRSVLHDTTRGPADMSRALHNFARSSGSMLVSWMVNQMLAHVVTEPWSIGKLAIHTLEKYRDKITSSLETITTGPIEPEVVLEWLDDMRLEQRTLSVVRTNDSILHSVSYPVDSMMDRAVQVLKRYNGSTDVLREIRFNRLGRVRKAWLSVVVHKVCCALLNHFLGEMPYDRHMVKNYT